MKRKLRGSLELSTALFLSLVSSSNPVLAQITPDNTLGGEQSTVQPNVLINGLPSDQINGGAIRGTNLFHSFLEFNVGAGRGAYFTNPAGIENIFSRVTGNTPSNILGTLGVLGNANLFLMNPNGIVFRPSASLHVTGSFLSTTASRITFADGTQFSVPNSQTPPLLTVSVPVGLGFGSTPGEISVQGANLQVLPNQTLALVGGNVTLQGGNLTAPGGRLELGSVAGSSLVNLTPTAKGWALGYSGVKNFRDIQLSQGVSVDASGEGGGKIQLQGRNVSLTDGSRVVTHTLGSQPGEGIQVNASESVQITGSGNYVQDILPLATGMFNPSDLRNGFFTLSLGSGAAGNIEINTRQFTASNGAFVASYTFGSGRAGDLTLKTSDAVDLTTSGLLTVAGIGPTGDAGNVTINTSRLTMQDNAVAITLTFGLGQGGKLTAVASDSIDLTETTPLIFDNNVSLQTSLATNTFGDGNAGEALISTQRLTLTNGATIQSATGGNGTGGRLTVNASKSVTLVGSGLDGQVPSSLTAETGASGNGGSLFVNTEKLVIRDGAGLFVSSSNNVDNPGAAGSINVAAHSISLNRGKITAEAAGNQGGDITLQTQSLIMRNQSQITATADTGSQGGNIRINAGVIGAVPRENSDITANAPQGTGGRIIINTQGIFGLQVSSSLTPKSDITAFGKAAELNGIIQINTPDINLQNALNTQEANFVNPDQ